jgi:hypothetical protein
VRPIGIQAQSIPSFPHTRRADLEEGGRQSSGRDLLPEPPGNRRSTAPS